MRIVDVPRDLTAYEFYNNLLPNIVGTNEQELCLDMSNTKRIEPLVIPNLLCLAFIEKRNSNKRLVMSIPDTVSGGMVRNYLNQIGFTYYANKYDLFEFQFNPYGGLEGKQIDPLCKTLIFNADDSLDNIYRGVEMCISPFSEAYLSKFQIYDSENCIVANEITEFLEEILFNCKKHARSFSITTMHANYAAKKIYIAVSDVGCGFMSSLNKQSILAGIHDEIDDELMGILHGVYRRKDSKIYGLYNVIRRVLDYDGRVRIHSNDTQIIFTPRIKQSFTEKNILNTEGFKKYNVKNTVKYDGVHIEIEIPLEKDK